MIRKSFTYISLLALACSAIDLSLTLSLDGSPFASQPVIIVLLQAALNGFTSSTTDLPALGSFYIASTQGILSLITMTIFAWFVSLLICYIFMTLTTLWIFPQRLTKRFHRPFCTLCSTISAMTGLCVGIIVSAIYLNSYYPPLYTACLLGFALAGYFLAGLIPDSLSEYLTSRDTFFFPVVSVVIGASIAFQLLSVITTPGISPGNTGPNVILIVVDTLREDALGIAGRNDGCSPEIDRFFKDSFQVTDFRSNSSWTAPSFASLFTGFEPHIHGVVEGDIGFKPRHTTLAESFRNNGYDTFGLFCNPVLIGSCGYERGYDLYFNNILHRDASDTQSSAVGLIPTLESSSRFFLTLQFMDCHTPYTPARRLDNRITASPLPQTFPIPAIQRTDVDPSQVMPYEKLLAHRAMYQQSLRDADAAIGAFLRELQSRNLLDQTIVILTSDHGEEFKEHGSLDHCATVYEEVVRIPLLIKSRTTQSRIIAGPRMLSDLGSTILDLAGIISPLGNDINLLQPINPHRPVFLETRRYGYTIGSVIVDNFKYIAPVTVPTKQPVFKYYYPRPWNGTEVYKLNDDPQEKFPVDIAEDHRAALKELWNKIPGVEPVKSWNTRQMDSETLQALTELGYIQ